MPACVVKSCSVLDKNIYGICITGSLIIQQLNYCILVGLNTPIQEKTMKFSMLHRHLIFSFGCWYNRHMYYLKKNRNAPRPSEHPPVRGKNVK